MSEFKKMKLSEARARFEQIDETSKEKATEYTKAAYNSLDRNNRKIGTHEWEKRSVDAGMRIPGRNRDGGPWNDDRNLTYSPDDIKGINKKIGKRLGGLNRAHKIIHKEEMEQVSEADYSKHTTAALQTLLSPGTLRRSESHLKPAIRKELKKRNANEEVELSEMDKSPESPKFNPARLGPGGAPAKPIPLGSKGYQDMEDMLNSRFAKTRDDFKKARADAKSLKKEETEGCMLDTSMGGADQIAQSKTGEVYKKSAKQSTGPSPATGTSTHVVAGKGGEAYNTSGITKRVPAVESAALGVFEKTLEKRRIFEDASNIAIISPDQRQDWLNVSAGRMDVVDYFNKYRV